MAETTTPTAPITITPETGPVSLSNNAISTATHPNHSEIQLPADNKAYQTPSIWPLATGWWLAIILLLIALGFTTYKGYRYWQMKRQQDAILHALTTFDKALQHDKSSVTISHMNQLLRRLALMHFPRQQVASLTGEQWLRFLDKTGNTTEFSKGAGRILAYGPYIAQLPETIDQQGLTKAIRQWLTHINNAYHQQRDYKSYLGSRSKQWK